MSKKHKKLAFKYAPLMLAIIAIGSLALMYGKYKIFNSTSNPQALVSYIPNFDNLTLNDLPNHTSFRDVQEYNGRVIVIEINKIIEYDKANHNFVRVSDPKVLGCIYDSTRIGKFLYVSCNPRYKGGEYTPETKSIIAAKLTKIDLDTGQIVKEYFGEELPIPSKLGWEYLYNAIGTRSNLVLGSKGDVLYMSSRDGIEKMDTKTEKITLYSGPNLIKPGDELTGTGLGLPEWFNKSPIESPEFKSISLLRDGKYYIAASDGVYTLVKGQFPQKFVDFDIKAQELTRSIISQDGNYVIFVGARMERNMGQVLAYGVDVYLVDISKQKLIDLGRTIKRVRNPRTENLSDEISKKIKDGYFEEVDGVISLKDLNKDILFSIDLTNSNLQIKVK